MATPARITPSAVPKPAVASEPVLQWVSTPRAGLDQARAQFAHVAVGGEVFALDRERLALDDLPPVRAGGGEHAAHAGDGPHQVHRGGPRLR